MASAEAGKRKTPLMAENGEFVLNGKKVKLLSGAMHYFRIVPEYWKDRLMRLKAAGLNCLETYMPWNLHEEVRGEFNFSGILDVRKYVEMARDLGFYVLIRPGPYICAEWEFGGLPSWLLSDPKMQVRSPYKPYVEACASYINAVMEQLRDLQCSNGGPIIGFQIENEYGSYGKDPAYKEALKKAMIDSGVTEFFFTSDNGVGINKGDVEGEQITCNFQEQEHGYFIMEYVENYKCPGWPLMAMEFWTGWFDHWGEKHHVWPPAEFEKTLTWILKRNSSMNLYMAHGGTTFGFMNGANEGLGATNAANVEPYAADITSYDYDAPISENGDLSEKFFVLRRVLQELVPDEVPKDLPDPPANIPSKSYGKVEMNQYMPLENILKHVPKIINESPLKMEELKTLNNGGGQSFGFIVYRTTVKKEEKDRTIKFQGKIRDRGIIMWNKSAVDTVECTSPDHETTITEQLGQEESNVLDVFVENCGRVNYADFKSPILNRQRKGLVEKVTIDGEEMKNWEMYPMEFKKGFFESISNASSDWNTGDEVQSRPRLYRGELHIQGAPCDTWIDMSGWTKGNVWVNSFNLGRFWKIGPQVTLYLPGPLLKEGKNEIIILELHGTEQKSVTLTDKRNYGEEIIHTTAIPNAERMLLSALRNVRKMGPWVWKPIGFFYRFR